MIENESHNDRAPKLSGSLEALLFLVGVTSNGGERPVPSSNVIGAVEDIVDSGHHQVSDEFGTADSRVRLFHALDELISLGYLRFSYEGYSLSDQGRRRLGEIQDEGEHDDLVEAAVNWRP